MMQLKILHAAAGIQHSQKIEYIFFLIKERVRVRKL